MTASGELFLVPAGSANGTKLESRLKDAEGPVFYLDPSDSITYTVANTPPMSPPIATITVSGTDYALWSEALNAESDIYLTAVSGTPKFRWQ